MTGQLNCLDADKNRSMPDKLGLLSTVSVNVPHLDFLLSSEWIPRSPVARPDQPPPPMDSRSLANLGHLMTIQWPLDSGRWPAHRLTHSLPSLTSCLSTPAHFLVIYRPHNCGILYAYKPETGDQRPETENPDPSALGLASALLRFHGS